MTLVDKANVLPSMAYFRGIFDEVAREFPDISTDRIYVDAAALYLVERPQTFDVIVTENMFGDILSDLAAGLVGGMGMAPSADIGDRFAVFQPSHGSAPSIAGRGIANPVATILSVAMMLDWFGAPERAALIRSGRAAGVSPIRKRGPSKWADRWGPRRWATRSSKPWRRLGVKHETLSCVCSAYRARRLCHGVTVEQYHAHDFAFSGDRERKSVRRRPESGVPGTRRRPRDRARLLRWRRRVEDSFLPHC